LDNVTNCEFASSGSPINLGTFTFNLSFSFNIGTFLTNLPRLLQTSVVTTYTPVCKREDIATGTWTTDGITTVDNGNDVSCVTTKPGRTTIVFELTTTDNGTGNTNTGTNDGSSDDSVSVGLIVGTTIAGLIVIAMVIVTIILVKKAKSKKRKEFKVRNAPVEMVSPDLEKNYFTETGNDIIFNSPERINTTVPKPMVTMDVHIDARRIEEFNEEGKKEKDNQKEDDYGHSFTNIVN